MIKIPGVIPIVITPYFWILAAAIGWMNAHNIVGAAIWVGLILLSVIVHELGHAVTAWAWGQNVSIQLVAFGGITLREGARLKLWKEFIIILNGPLAGLLLSFTCWCLFVFAKGPLIIMSGLFFDAFAINLFWTVINLLPIQPLDGGKLISILLESLFGLKGVKLSLCLSILFATAMSLFLFSTSHFLAGAFFFLFAYESWGAWKNTRIVSEQDQNLALQHFLKDADRDKSIGNREEALRKLINVRELAKSGVIHLTATEEAASILVEKGELEEAYQLLVPLKSKLTLNGLHLLQQLAFLQGFWQEAIAAGDEVYQKLPHYEVARINALSHAALGHTTPAIGWLKRSICDGIPNVKELLAEKEFDSIRTDPFFPKV